jgi:hypothetical protein
MGGKLGMKDAMMEILENLPIEQGSEKLAELGERYGTDVALEAFDRLAEKEMITLGITHITRRVP